MRILVQAGTAVAGVRGGQQRLDERPAALLQAGRQRAHVRRKQEAVGQAAHEHHVAGVPPAQERHVGGGWAVAKERALRRQGKAAAAAAAQVVGSAERLVRTTAI